MNEAWTLCSQQDINKSLDDAQVENERLNCELAEINDKNL